MDSRYVLSALGETEAGAKNMFRLLDRLTRLATGRRREHTGYLLGLVLNNMTQGVVMFDLSGRLIFFNDQYLAMYGLSPDIVKPGAKLVDIILHRFASGTLGRDPQEYCDDLLRTMAAGQSVSFVTEGPDGRAISVINRAIPGNA